MDNLAKQNLHMQPQGAPLLRFWPLQHTAEECCSAHTVPSFFQLLWHTYGSTFQQQQKCQVKRPLQDNLLSRDVEEH